MFNIGSFFEKFNNAALREMKTRQIIADSIQAATGVVVESKNITFRNKVVTIQANPAEKSQIFIKKESVISNIKNKLPGIIISDLR
jgi:hypothetical protein